MQEQKNTRIIDFIPIQKIGEGSFSSVYKVQRIADNKFYALKKVKINNLKKKQKQNALNEVRILASLNSDYIIKYKQAFFDQKYQILCIVMEWANQGDLHVRIKQKANKRQYFQESQIWKAINHLLLGLNDLHSRQILHRDLKCGNVFMNDGVYKIGDLNVSKVQYYSKQLAFTQTGTPYYASPQVWRDQPYDSKSDIWSFGCIIYQLCALKPPFSGLNMQQLFHNVQKGQYEPIKNSYSSQLSQLIRLCLSKNPTNRLSCSQMLQKYQKRFINKKNSIEKNKKLLKTIIFDGSLKNIQKSLPQANYYQNQNYRIHSQFNSLPKNQNYIKKNGRNLYRLHSYGRNKINQKNQIINKRYQRNVNSAKHSQLQKNQDTVLFKNKKNIQNIQPTSYLHKQFQGRQKINNSIFYKIAGLRQNFSYKIPNSYVSRNISQQKILQSSDIKNHIQKVCEVGDKLQLDIYGKRPQFSSIQRSASYNVRRYKDNNASLEKQKSINQKSNQQIKQPIDNHKLKSQRKIGFINNYSYLVNKPNPIPYYRGFRQIPRSKKLINRNSQKQSLSYNERMIIGQYMSRIMRRI